MGRVEGGWGRGAVGGALAIGLKKAIFRVSRSTCRLLSGCLTGLHVRFHGRRNSRRVVGSFRVHVSRLFGRQIQLNCRIVAVRRIRRMVGHVNGPRRLFRNRRRGRCGRRTEARTFRRRRVPENPGGLVHSPSGQMLKNMTNNVTTCVK